MKIRNLEITANQHLNAIFGGPELWFQDIFRPEDRIITLKEPI
jgi:hypothetical protein